MGKLVIKVILAILAMYFVTGFAALVMHICTWQEFTQFVAPPSAALWLYLQVRPEKKDAQPKVILDTTEQVNGTN